MHGQFSCPFSRCFFYHGDTGFFIRGEKMNENLLEVGDELFERINAILGEDNNG